MDTLSSCSTADTAEAEAVGELQQESRGFAYVPGRVLRCAASEAPAPPVILELEKCFEQCAAQPSPRSAISLPSKGSLGHACGLCQPCEFFHKERCMAGANCRFCHLCGPEEVKLRRKAKRFMKRMEKVSCQQGCRCGN